MSRLHGDEFAVLTNLNIDEIVKSLKECEKMIEESVPGRIPTSFKFNCGIASASNEYEHSFDQADYMMYTAKKNKKMFQIFDYDIWKQKLKFESFYTSLISDSKTGKLVHYYNPLFDRFKNKSGIIQVYTKGRNSNNLFDDNTYGWLRANYKISDFDINNLQFIIENSFKDDDKKIVYIDYTTLSNNKIPLKDISNFLSGVDVSKIILSIDLSNFNIGSYEKLINNINYLKSMGFCVVLDKYNFYLSDALWDNTDPEFIGISKYLWRESMNDSKKEHMLRNKLDLFDYYDSPSIPIFSHVQSEEEFEYLRNITSDYSLFTGRYFSQEKELLLKK